MASSPSRRTRHRNALSALLRPSLGAAADPWAALLEELARRGAAALPGVRVPPSAMARQLAAARAGQLPELETLRRHGEDFFLACACARGGARALALFDARMVAPTSDAVRRVDGSRAFVDEVQQRLRERLLLPGRDGARKISSYVGRGPLETWVRAAALRVAFDLTRDERELPCEPAQLEATELAEPDPDLALLKRRHGPLFNQAFRAAVGSLSDRERAVLRMYLLQRMNVAEIGLAYQVDRTTVVRWIVRAREALLERTRAQLAEALHLSRAEADSLLRALRSELDVSLRRHLDPGPG